MGVRRAAVVGQRAESGVGADVGGDARDLARRVESVEAQGAEDRVKVFGWDLTSQVIAWPGSRVPSSFTAQLDPDSVVRMLDNVLGNALKFTAAGGLVRISLQARSPLSDSLAARLAAVDPAGPPPITTTS